MTVKHKVNILIYMKVVLTKAQFCLLLHVKESLKIISLAALKSLVLFKEFRSGFIGQS